MKQITQTAKNVLLENGSHSPQIMIPTKEGMLVMLCLFSNYEEKKKLRDTIKKQITELKIDNYFFIAESWVTLGDKDNPKYLARPSRMVERQEALVITEFRRDLKGKGVLIPFEKKKGKIRFKKKIDLPPGSSNSLWDVYVDEEEVQREMDRGISENNQKVIDNIKKELLNKYSKKLKEAKTAEEEVKIIKELVKEADEKKREMIDKKLYEDVD